LSPQNKGYIYAPSIKGNLFLVISEKEDQILNNLKKKNNSYVNC